MARQSKTTVQGVDNGRYHQTNNVRSSTITCRSSKKAHYRRFCMRNPVEVVGREAVDSDPWPESLDEAGGWEALEVGHIELSPHHEVV